MQNFIKHRSIATTALSAALCLLMLNTLGGCVVTDSTTQPSALTQNAEKDPMNYSPDFSSDNISGGKINEYDQGAMNRDVDHFLNP